MCTSCARPIRLFPTNHKDKPEDAPCTPRANRSYDIHLTRIPRSLDLWSANFSGQLQLMLFWDTLEDNTSAIRINGKRDDLWEKRIFRWRVNNYIWRKSATTIRYVGDPWRLLMKLFWEEKSAKFSDEKSWARNTGVIHTIVWCKNFWQRNCEGAAKKSTACVSKCSYFKRSSANTFYPPCTKKGLCTPRKNQWYIQ